MRTLFVCFLILFTTTGHAAKPDWVKNYGYSEERPVHIYLIGFGSAWESRAELRQIAADDARAEVSRNIITKVKSVIRTSESEIKSTLSHQYKGETMKVFVRVNRESYLRLLYILADGSRTLLHDNYYIDQFKSNRVVEIPEEFECAPPFGAELLVVVARTEAFPPIQTYESDGYLFLSAKDAGQAARGFRGMKK